MDDQKLAKKTSEIATHPTLSPEAPAKDGDLAINQSAVAEKQAATVEAPVIIKEEDIVAEPSPEQLAEQIEVLTGEIQALESKIERITGSSSPTPTPPAVEIKSTVTTNQGAFVSSPPAIPHASVVPKSSINDIYPKTTARDQLNPVPTGAFKDDSVVPAEESGGKTTALIIAEALTFFAVIVFILLAASPLYQETIGSSVTGVLYAVGWPVVIITAFLGVVVGFLAKDSWGVRIMSIVVVVVAGIIYLGTGSLSNFLGPAKDLLEPLLQMYRSS